MCLFLVTWSCPTLCDPKDCSPPGSSIHGDSPSKNIGAGSHTLPSGNLPNPGHLHCGWILYQLSHQGSQVYWSGYTSPGDLPDPGIEPGSPALGADSLSVELPGKPKLYYHLSSNPHNLYATSYMEEEIKLKFLFPRRSLISACD